MENPLIDWILLSRLNERWATFSASLANAHMVVVPSATLGTQAASSGTVCIDQIKQLSSNLYMALGTLMFAPANVQECLRAGDHGDA